VLLGTFRLRDDHLDPSIEELNRAVISEAESRPAAVCLMQQRGVGSVTALAFVLDTPFTRR
jgi:hypothetical protein